MRLFYSYAHEDAKYRDELEKHLKPLERAGLISDWSDEELLPGEEWRERIEVALREADIIVFLVSADFMSSDFIWDVELRQAMERHQQQTALVIPVIVRPTDWSGTMLGQLQAVPAGGRAVTQWENQDEAWLDVVQGVRRLVERRQQPKSELPAALRPLRLNPPQLPDQLTPGMLVAQAEGLMFVGRQQEARAELERALAAPATDIDAQTARARALMLLQRPGEALNAFNAVLQQRPGHPDALVGRAQVLGGMGQYPAAMADLQMAISAGGNPWYAIFIRGQIYEALQNPQAARYDYDHALGLWPQAVVVLVARGYLQGRFGDHVAALRDFDQALALNPKNVPAMVGRGWGYLYLGRAVDALRQFDEALALEPNNMPAINGRTEAQKFAP